MRSLAKEIGRCIGELESTSQCIEIAHISVVELKDWRARAAALEREVEALRGYITAAANRAGLAWHQGNTDSAVFWRAALVGIERDLRKALAGGEAG